MPGALLHPALARVALAALGAEPAAAPAGPILDRTAQERLLERIVERDGPEGVLAAGRHLDVVLTEPLVLVLLNTDGVALLLEKLDRLNRFFHSHHRHRVLELAEGRARLEHHSISGEPPTVVESTFVCGLYLELLARIGCGGVTCAFPRTQPGGRIAYRRGHPVEVPAGDTREWLVEWTDFEPTRPLPGLDDILLRDTPVDLSEHTVDVRVELLLRSDLARPWKVESVARHLSVSPRTLQRRLAEQGRSFTRILRDARVERAKELLRTASYSITDTGYATGFADTSHFTRVFRDATGHPPGVWRALLGRTPTGACAVQSISREMIVP